MTTLDTTNISLIPLRDDDREQFILDNQCAFKYGAQEEFSINSENAETYMIVNDGNMVGGLILQIDKQASKGDLDILFIKPEAHNKGFGKAAWRAVEAMHPEIQTWETMTPYFEKRNIHFYVNCLGFHIVEFWNRYRHGPAIPDDIDENWSEDDEMFLFRKNM